jgi:membrane protease YdiL (CAAX protease family)
MIKINKTCLFLIITFVISYSIAAVFWMINKNFDKKYFQIGFTIMAAIYMFVPFISAILVKKIHKEPIMSDFSISFKINRWFFVSWLIMPVIVFCSLGISLLFPNITYNPELTGLFDRTTDIIPPEQIEEFKTRMNSLPVNFVWLALIQGLIAGATINAIAAFGEETGWRGFFLKGLKDMRFFKAALIIGSIWGIWHAPLILMGHNYPQHPKIGVFMMTVFCILLTPIMQYLRIKSKSVIAAAIAHGTINAIAAVSIMAVSGGNDLTTGITGLPGLIALIIFTLAIFVYDYFIRKEKIMVNKLINYV